MTFDKSVVVPLDPDATFALVTEPERLRRWLAVAARVELRPGGDYRWTVTPGHTAAGTVVDVDPGKRVVYSWGWEDGDPAPGGSTVTVTLTPVDGGTEVRLVHDGLTDEQAAHHAVGWNHFLGRLVAAGRDGDAGPDEWVAVGSFGLVHRVRSFKKHPLLSQESSNPLSRREGGGPLRAPLHTTMVRRSEVLAFGDPLPVRLSIDPCECSAHCLDIGALHQRGNITSQD